MRCFRDFLQACLQDFMQARRPFLLDVKELEEDPISDFLLLESFKACLKE